MHNCLCIPIYCILGLSIFVGGACGAVRSATLSQSIPSVPIIQSIPNINVRAYLSINRISSITRAICSSVKDEPDGRQSPRSKSLSLTPLP